MKHSDVRDRMSKAARLHAVEHFDTRKNAARIQQLLIQASR